jgi:hypothetical protein
MIAGTLAGAEPPWLESWTRGCWCASDLDLRMFPSPMSVEPDESTRLLNSRAYFQERDWLNRQRFYPPSR